VIVGLLLGVASSAWLARRAHDHELFYALPNPWLTASFGVGIVAAGWVLALAWPRFAANFAASALPGAIYAALMLSGDGAKELAYGWAAIPVALGWLALHAGLSGSSSRSRNRSRAWSARRASAPRVPRVRTR